MSDPSDDRTASLMTPARLAQLQLRQPVSSPAAWLDQLATDAGSGHVRRLVDLRRQLETLVRERDEQGVRGALQALQDDLQKLDYDALRPRGWWARTLGQGKEEAVGFVAQVGHIVRAAEDLAQEVRALQRRQLASDGAGARALVEFDVEVRAIEKIMEQGTRWLQDMRNQLKARSALPGEQARQVRADTLRCELLVERLKQLRGAVTAAQRAGERCKTAAARRADVVQTLQRALDGEWRSWHDRLEPVAAEAAGSGSVAEGVGRAKAVQQELQLCLRQAANDCAQLRKQEETLAADLAALHEPLQAAA
ncbi:MAG: hypothetical protein JWP65_3963 [Ramlibacter sp.]|uniref:hypothetical protein n=1 Tax=Ramlibacter sp. TaxID=1917967 RepID=UPI00261EFCF8|nr:hypothetical protein [Ramlibacter sp.]MDB5753542.1 hypothetical protein [Ramlibacter sp.]